MPDQVEILFEPSTTKIQVASGSTILAASEAAGVEILTGCTQGMCGTDAVQIVTGLENLSTPEDHELGTLERMGLEADFRLACSARVMAGAVQVRLDAF